MGHRYWRAISTSPMQDSGSLWGIAEMRMAESLGGQNICIAPGHIESPYIGLCSSFFNDDYPPGRAFNNNLHGVASVGFDAPWSSMSETNHFLGMDFGSSYFPSVREFKIWCRSDSQFGNSATSITFQHSDDGVTWEDVISYTGLTWTINNATEADAHVFVLPPEGRRGQTNNPI